MSGGDDGNGGAMDGPARVEAALRACGLTAPIERFPEGTATALDAASALGCELGQIVKTLILLADGRPTAALVAGDRQADTAALARLLGVSRKRLKLARAERVLELTGYRVGGVPPVGLPGDWDVIADDSLLRFTRVWAAAGASDALFGATTEELLSATGAQVAAIGVASGR